MSDGGDDVERVASDAILLGGDDGQLGQCAFRDFLKQPSSFFPFPKRNAAAGVLVEEGQTGMKFVTPAVVGEHPFLALHVLFVGGYLPAAGEKGDGGGFNGIGARWIARFMKERGEQAAFEPWLQKNAEAAWQARRASDNLSWCRWPQPTPEDRRYSWGCSSAVVLMQVVRPTEPLKPPHFKMKCSSWTVGVISGRTVLCS